jgi:TonB family protein
MRSTLAGFCLVATLASASAGVGATGAKTAAAYQAEARAREESLEKIEGQLHRGEWAAAEVAARPLVDDAMLRKGTGTFDAVARLALAAAAFPKLAKGKSEEKVQRPKVLESHPPRYPEYLRSQRVQATVILESAITTTGLLRNLVLLSLDAPPGMEASALDTVCDWRFEPAVYRGEPVPVHYSLTVNFQLRR